MCKADSISLEGLALYEKEIGCISFLGNSGYLGLCKTGQRNIPLD